MFIPARLIKSGPLCTVPGLGPNVQTLAVQICVMCTAKGFSDSKWHNFIFSSNEEYTNYGGRINIIFSLVYKVWN